MSADATIMKRLRGCSMPVNDGRELGSASPTEENLEVRNPEPLGVRPIQGATTSRTRVVFADLVAALGVSEVASEVMFADSLPRIEARSGSFSLEDLMRLSPDIARPVEASKLLSEGERAMACEPVQELLRNAAARRG